MNIASLRAARHISCMNIASLHVVSHTRLRQAQLASGHLVNLGEHDGLAAGQREPEVQCVLEAAIAAGLGQTYSRSQWSCVNKGWFGNGVYIQIAC